jgi:hypothetical protein
VAHHQLGKTMISPSARSIRYLSDETFGDHSMKPSAKTRARRLAYRRSDEGAHA